MFLDSLLSQSLTVSQAIIYIIAFIGIILFPYSVFLEQAHRKDLVQLIAASCLLVYALYIQEPLFVILMSAIALASVVEFTEIFLGLHKHAQDDLKKYKKMWRHGKKAD